jgi:hypothetical protein
MCNIFVKMIKQYHAAAGDSASYLVKCSVCASIAYVVLLNINYRTYAVGSNPGICRDNQPDSPPAGWKKPTFCTKNLHNVQIFCAKDKKCTTLPQAILPFTG